MQSYFYFIVTQDHPFSTYSKFSWFVLVEKKKFVFPKTWHTYYMDDSPESAKRLCMDRFSKTNTDFSEGKNIEKSIPSCIYQYF